MGNHSNSHRNQAIDLQELINGFGKYLKNTRGLAPRTIQNYCSDVKAFFQAQCMRKKIYVNRMSSKKVIRSF